MNSNEPKPLSEGWTAQGFGMLRRYYGENRRLHVWLESVRVKEATRIHTHPWDFHSYVLAKSMRNRVYARAPGWPASPLEYTLQCGREAKRIGEPVPICLGLLRDDTVPAGQGYAQTHDQIHESEFETGAVTIVQRWPAPNCNPDLAQSFVPLGAEPVHPPVRDATPEEGAEALAILETIKGFDFASGYPYSAPVKP